MRKWHRTLAPYTERIVRTSFVLTLLGVVAFAWSYQTKPFDVLTLCALALFAATLGVATVPRYFSTGLTSATITYGYLMLPAFFRALTDKEDPGGFIMLLIGSVLVGGAFMCLLDVRNHDSHHSPYVTLGTALVTPLIAPLVLLFNHTRPLIGKVLRFVIFEHLNVAILGAIAIGFVWSVLAEHHKHKPKRHP